MLKPAIFIDRDGVINKEKNYLHKKEDFEMEDKALLGMKSIDFNKYLVFIISNQSGIGRGYYSQEDFKKFDSWLCGFLKKKGINISKTYYCPHRPEEKCSCRKPKIGLLLKAKQDFNVDLKNSYLIGDKTSDILAGKRAGCKTILVKTGYQGKDKLFSVKADFTADNLLEAINII